MTALVFLFSLAVIFGAVLAVETQGFDVRALRRPAGLIGWLTGGNWPAKIGGGLLVVGVGALLRYALINFDVAPSIKLGTGVLAAGLLGLAAMLTRIGSAKRAVSLALGGAAFGVAYLTAYSAFALFHYLDSSTGIVLLLLTAIGAGVYAVTRSALSLALLAMVGAFLAPAFAVDDPGPLVVYGYYAAASALTLLMVAVRGWRPLIHLSFLFTLLGGVFFAWTAKYYSAEHASIMLPALLVLAAIHVAMPLLERQSGGKSWGENLDLVYMIVLPAVAALTALVIAPSRENLSTELMALAAIWSAAALGLWALKREGVALHAVVAVLLLGLGAAARYRNLPWELMALAFSVGALWLAVRRSHSERLHNALAGLVPLLAMLNIVSSLSPIPGSPAFANGRFVERLVGAGLLMFAGYICRRARLGLDTLLWSVGVGWALISIGAELIRWDLISLALVMHGAFLLAGVVLAWVTSRSQLISRALVVVPLGIIFSAGWATGGTPQGLSWLFMFVAPAVLTWLAVRRAGVDESTRAGRILSAVSAPLVAGVWAAHAGSSAGIGAPQFALSIAVAVALLVLYVGYVLPKRGADWLAAVGEISAYAFAAILLVATVFRIGRSPWALPLELLSLAGLISLAWADSQRGVLPRWLGAGAALGLGLVLQAQLLRWFGPAGSLDITDISRMRLPTLASLLWATAGGALTVWGRRHLSRPLWVAGASLLVAAAVKLVLLDFGSLGQLANILAVIAAGVVFLLVGWLAPMPPTAVPDNIAGAGSTEYRDRNARHSSADAKPVPETSEKSSRRTAWIIAILVTCGLPLAQCGRSTVDAMRRNLPARQAVPFASAPVVAPAAVPLETACSQWVARLPDDYVVYAAGGSSGKALDFTIDESNHRAQAFDVTVHQPGQNVVLVLGSYNASIWNVRWSADTHIVGAWISGHYRQLVTGLGPDTPVLESSDATGACPYFDLGDAGQARVARAVGDTLGRNIETLVLANNGSINIGSTESESYYTQIDAKPFDAFRDQTRPLAGQKGIDELLRAGDIRVASASDIESASSAMSAPGSESARLFRAYTVLRPITIPADLYGAYAVTLIIPRGVERPRGNPGHSALVDLNQ
jgi:hypothetical protein